MKMQRLRVKEVAQAKGFTMAKLQRAADINLKTIQAIYRDPYRDVAYSTLNKIAKALGVSIADLVEEVPDDATP
jgi:DNA-binding Xre family transcriptional regulator